MIRYELLLFMLSLVVLCFPAAICVAQPQRIIVQAEKPSLQVGSRGRDFKSAALTGEVLGQEFGGEIGHFTEYTFVAKQDYSSPLLGVRYARAFADGGFFQATLDGQDVGLIPYTYTGGWGEAPSHFDTSYIALPPLAAGEHRIRLTVTDAVPDQTVVPGVDVSPSPILDLVGNRSDKNSVGNGKNVALFTGKSSKVFYATYEMGEIFSAANGGTISWWPDHVLVSPEVVGVHSSARPNVNIDVLEIFEDPDREHLTKVSEVRQVCVTEDDVIVSVIHLHNPGQKVEEYELVITGDLRQAHDWREQPGGRKLTENIDGVVVLTDVSAFGEILHDGLSLAVGSTVKPETIHTHSAGTYQVVFRIPLEPGETKTLKAACAIHPNRAQALANLKRTLKEEDPIAENRKSWEEFYQEDIPRFTSSDPGLDELYAFRWFLLRFSTAGGDLGFFKYPVVMEGREAYQTYCCYSAPFMAFDMNWVVDPLVGFGHIANMCLAAYEDGRFPWYTSPRTNHVPLHHQSKTGLSLLPFVAWKHYLVHGDLGLIQEIYPALAENVRWWIKDRDPDGNGLFVITHQLETGMDDLFRWQDPLLRYEAIDATSYAYANLKAVSSLAQALGNEEEAAYFVQYAQRTAQALNSLLWDEDSSCYRDRHPSTKQLASQVTITTFYPFFAGIGQNKEFGVFTEHLLNPKRFWLAYPVPALSKQDPDFNPTGFWQGPAWPAATSHVLEAFATSAKDFDRSYLPQAALLLRRAVNNHLRPRADFYERYNPLTGAPLSTFRDYMHSWWVDLYIRHVAGFMIEDDGTVRIDPLPLGLEYFSMSNIPYRGKRIDITWQEPGVQGDLEPGLTVYVDGQIEGQFPEFYPGDNPILLEF
ncbi:MAG: hypothetical protein M0Q40_06075 [Limnochordia bacterium]|nr:hypothetical protein [Limnochordia bacterium]